MKSALREWGSVKSITFTGTAGPRDWTFYRVRPDSQTGFTAPTAAVLLVRLGQIGRDSAVLNEMPEVVRVKMNLR